MILGSCLLLLNACSVDAGNVAQGGVAGGLAGAGTGAIVGAIISNGDIGASALLGGAIGIPVGLVLGAVYDYHSDERVRERKREQIEATQVEISARQRDIDALREKIRAEGPLGNPSPELREYQYNGATLGNYYR